MLVMNNNTKVIFDFESIEEDTLMNDGKFKQEYYATVSCRTHGPFWVGMQAHLDGEGCPKCDRLH
jgi:hypothetical protein